MDEKLDRSRGQGSKINLLRSQKHNTLKASITIPSHMEQRHALETTSFSANEEMPRAHACTFVF